MFAPVVEGVLTSFRFLASTALACGLTVALALWVAGDATGVARALAGLVGLGASLAVMLLIAWAVADESEAHVVPAASPEPAPVAATALRESNGALRRCLEEGRALQRDPDPRSVDAWIRVARETIEGCRPGVAGYFNALARRTYADDGLRLDAHLKRLETIVRDAS